MVREGEHGTHTLLLEPGVVLHVSENNRINPFIFSHLSSDVQGRYSLSLPFARET